MISITSKGDYKKTYDFLNKLERKDFLKDLDKYGQQGVAALSKSTPIDTSNTAHSWKFRILRGKNPGIEWYNTNMAGDTPVAILIQYGHGTGTGGYVQGRDYINPAMRPTFDKIADEIWKKVKA